MSTYYARTRRRRAHRAIAGALTTTLITLAMLAAFGAPTWAWLGFAIAEAELLANRIYLRLLLGRL